MFICLFCSGFLAMGDVVAMCAIRQESSCQFCGTDSNVGKGFATALKLIVDANSS